MSVHRLVQKRAHGADCCSQRAPGVDPDGTRAAFPQRLQRLDELGGVLGSDQSVVGLGLWAIRVRPADRETRRETGGIEVQHELVEQRAALTGKMFQARTRQRASRARSAGTAGKLHPSTRPKALDVPPAAGPAPFPPSPPRRTRRSRRPLRGRWRLELVLRRRRFRRRRFRRRGLRRRKLRGRRRRGLLSGHVRRRPRGLTCC